MCVFTECYDLSKVDKGAKDRVAIKVWKVINSCTNTDQLYCAHNYLQNYESLYGTGRHQALRDLWFEKLTRLA